MKSFKRLVGLTLFLWVIPSIAFAATKSIDSGDTAWVLISAALVMMMTPAGLALFYGGMSRSKNVLNTMGMSFVSYGIVSVLWVIFQFSLAFGTDINGIIGNLRYLLMSTNINIVFDSTHVSVLAFAAFQLTFAAITTALISGSIVERVKFSSWVVFSIIWSTIVYTPLAHWVWGGGWLSKLGTLDFAGGTVVHINAGIAGLVFCLMLGKRRGFKKIAMSPASIVLTVLGAALLWLGWFGFNAGSELAADGLSGSAFLSTNTAAAIGAISWMSTEWVAHKHPTMLGAASGAVAGLVAITPAAGFVNILGALIIGAVSGVLGWFGSSYLKYKLGYDDSLDAFGVHGLNGIWGALATGIFADPAIGGAKGLLYGNSNQLFVQLVAVLATIAYSAVGTFIIVKITSLLTNGLRVDEESEEKGLDIAIHTEKGFEL
ncbi:ammonium transporter [Hippea maritima]|uniref:Ammonium transporter n=1 Tax=Hippea maritima (strain ATCC 700847 / DSM 10411 / MH2) TaxID=760142 RepID=F2LU01_HIPMA|nr:ammonium transporter [Hippea maritima]AEA33400.1 ammonium transporter [Hippea maritima DSM 10411]